jgi:hypothetical protein
MQRIKPLASAEAQVAKRRATKATTWRGAHLRRSAGPAGRQRTGRTWTRPTLNPKDRLARWQRKLLDLSLRNNLLNFKVGQEGLKLEAPDAACLEDLLADGQALKLLARPDLMDGATHATRPSTKDVSAKTCAAPMRSMP